MIANCLRANWPAPSNVLAGTTLCHANLSDLELPGEPCWLKQVHGTSVVEVAAYKTPPAADGSVGRGSGDVCVVQTADCLPVLFCASDGNDIAAAHAGWRGLAAGVIENTIAKMARKPAELMAWFGPAISQSSFEVGDEVREAFVAHDRHAQSCFEPNDRGRWQADLYALATLRLRAAGVTVAYGGGLCTYRDRERFFSYRRNPDCGRMASFVAIASP